MSKEALFNVLNNHFSFEGLKFGFIAGTGNISYNLLPERNSPITSVMVILVVLNLSNKMATADMILISRDKSDVSSF
jgi:multisubunit Na+/H+ antiporter MnhE subunit